MSNVRIFTLEEANALLPKISEIVGSQLARRAAIERKLGELATQSGKLPDGVEEDPADPPEIRSLKQDLLAQLHEYQSQWSQFESFGAVLKDARTGLIDFYSRVDGRTVLLCWQYGEASIAHYHELNSGVSGRKPLAGAVREQLYN